MGDPRKTRKKYKGPAHPWQKARIDEERGIKRNYGLKNKKEIWKFVSEIRRIKSQAKTLIREKSKNNKQAFIEEKQLIDRLVKYGLLTEGSTLESLLGLKTSDLLGRRLQTLVHNKGFALTPKQARQFIVHGHILVNSKRVNIPSYQVRRNDLISLREGSKKSVYFSNLMPQWFAKVDAPDWLEVNKDKIEIKVKGAPTLEASGLKIDDLQAIIEYYSR